MNFFKEGNMFLDENLNYHVQLQNQICEFKGMLAKLMQKLAKVQI
jgi:hypothetical protein